MSSKVIITFIRWVLPRFGGGICEVKAHLIGLLEKPWRRLFLAAYTIWLLLLSCVIVCVSCHCCPVWQTVVPYTVCKVEWFVLTIIKGRLLLLLLLLSFHAGLRMNLW